MCIIMKLKEKLFNFIDKVLSIKQELVMEEGSSLVCRDKEGIVTKTVKIVPTHIDRDADIKIEFPQFDVISTISKDGQYNVIYKQLLTLDVDSEPTEGSYKLLTSGQLYNIISDLQNQIDTLKDKINK